MNLKLHSFKFLCTKHITLFTLLSCVNFCLMMCADKEVENFYFMFFSWLRSSGIKPRYPYRKLLLSWINRSAKSVKSERKKCFLRGWEACANSFWIRWSTWAAVTELWRCRESSYVKGYDRRMEKGMTMVGSGMGKVFWHRELVQFVVSSRTQRGPSSSSSSTSSSVTFLSFFSCSWRTFHIRYSNHALGLE